MSFNLAVLNWPEEQSTSIRCLWCYLKPYILCHAKGLLNFSFVFFYFRESTLKCRLISRVIQLVALSTTVSPSFNHILHLCFFEQLWGLAEDLAPEIRVCITVLNLGDLIDPTQIIKKPFLLPKLLPLENLRIMDPSYRWKNWFWFLFIRTFQKYYSSPENVSAGDLIIKILV